jgi:uncharacterized protein (TIRG00374 family)
MARRHRLGPAVLAVVSALSLYLLLPSLLAVFGAWHSLARSDWRFAALALGCELLSIVALWQLDRLALHTRDWRTVAAAQLSGSAVGRVVPGGAATATAVSVSVLRQAGVETGEAAAGLAAATTLQLAATFALPVLALPAILAGSPVNRSLATAAYLGVAVLVLLLAAGAAAFGGDAALEQAGRAVQWLLNHTVRKGRPVEHLPQALLADRDFVAGTLGAHWRGALTAAAVSTAFDYLALLCALRAVGADPRPSLVLLAYTAGRLLGLIPFTPGGLGFVEAGLVGTLTLAGVSASQAASAAFVYRLVSYWLPIPAGAAAYGAFRLSAGRRRSSRSASARSPIPPLPDRAKVNASTVRLGGNSMDSTFDQARSAVGTQLTKMRWALGLNGVLSIAVGVVILVWPGISLWSLTVLFGAYSLATGVVGLVTAFSGGIPKSARGWLIVSSLLGIAVGVMVFLWTNISALALLYVIGAYAVALGIIAVGGAFWLPLDGGDTALMVLSGLVSILFGIVIFARPGAGALVVLALIAAFALVNGITEVVVAIGGKKMLDTGLRRVFTPKAQPSH